MSTLRFKALAELPFRNYRQDNFVEVPENFQNYSAPMYSQNTP
jgi:hypothetical protein